MIIIPTNEFQTQITDELLASLHTEVKDDLIDFISNIEFIKRLIDPNRKRAKDLERRDGRIIIDIMNPHILENMEYFREVGNMYRKYGQISSLRPNGNPNSEYGKFLAREITRCWDGMIRPSDGEWITGDMYFYLNYTPIIQSKIRPGTKQADRIVDFPEVWEGVYLVFHYLDQARNGGIYNDWKGGEHAVEIAKRGASKSYIVAALLAKLFIVGENKQSSKNVRGIVTAYQKESLIKDGTLNKFIEIIDFCAEHTQFPSQRLKDSMADMSWKMGYKDADTGVNKGTSNEILGVTAKDNVEKSRGKRANKFCYEEFGAFKKFIDIWTVNKPSVQEGDIVFGQAFAIGTGGSEGCLTANNQVFTKTGNLISIKDVNFKTGIIGHNFDKGVYSKEDIEHVNKPTYKECLKITTNSFRTIECSLEHPIWASNKYDYNECRVFNWINANILKIGDKVAIAKEINIFDDVPIFDARLIGLLIGDGSYVDSPRITSCDKEIQEYVRNRYHTKIYGNSYFTKDGKHLICLGINKIRDELRNLGIYGQSKNNKRLPKDIFLASKQDVSDLIGGLFDTDGSVNIYKKTKGNRLPTTTLNLSSSSLELLKEVQLLLMKIGVYSNILFHNPSKNENKRIKDKEGYYSLEISSRDSIIKFYENVTFLIKYKQDLLEECYNISLSKKRWKRDRGYEYETIVNIENIGMQKIYNLSAQNTHTYLANGIITHNSNFYGALEIIYNPIGYGVYALPNFFDKNSQGNQKTIFFFGTYLNRKGQYNSDGVSDVIGALIETLNDRVKIKYNSSDPLALTRAKAENPITIQEAIMRRDNNYYPVADINDTINDIDVNVRCLDYIGCVELSLSNGTVIPRPTGELKPIRDFPHHDNKLMGCCEVHMPPLSDSSGKVQRGRYIAGIDVYDDDASETLSLGSIFILDLLTDRIVFEYTGRPMFADDFYEICRRALLWYNAEANYENNKKGLFGYFSRMNCTYLLSDTLDFLKDKEMMKGGLYGNKAKGTVSTAPIKAYGRKINRDWLLKPIVTTKMVDDQEIEETIPNVKTLKSRALLKELGQWNPDGNFDRHDALLMLLLIREDKIRMFGERTVSSVLSNRRVNYLGDDPFFSNNYKKL